jgi:hypothetical protein
LQFEVLVEEDVCSRAPNLPSSPWMSELRNKEIGVYLEEE